MSEKERHEHLKLDQLYAEWLTSRARHMSPDSNSWGDDKAQNCLDREEELARLITTFPAVYPWMIFSKLKCWNITSGQKEARAGETTANL